MTDNAADEARKRTRIVRPIHRDTFSGVRRLRGRRYGKRAKIGGVLYEWTKVNDRGRWVRVD